MSFNEFTNELREMGVDEGTIKEEWEEYLRELNERDNENDS